jgi:nucleotide-binding universal stress UspA family protein
MTIWCGTDFSPSAAEAAEAAVALAARTGAPVRLLHVVDELGAEQAFDGGEDAAYRPRRARMDRLVAELMARHPGARLSGAVAPGFVEEALSGCARRPGDLLVVAALGRRPASVQRLLGGAAERTAQLAQTPVPVVRRAEPFSSWSASRPLRVVVGVDRSVQSCAAVRFVESLRALAPCDVTLVHVLSPGERTASERGLAGPAEAPSPEPARRVEQELRRELGELSGAGSRTWRIEPEAERVEEALAEQAAAADLLVVGNHQRRGLARWWYGSVSRGALTLASTNVALVPAVELPAEETPELRYQSALLPLALPPSSEDAAASLRALPYALGLLPPGGTLHLLHAVTDQPLTPELRDARLAELRAVAERSVHARAIKLELHLVPAADASAALVQAAAKLRVDALCLPLRRPSSPGAAQALLGATLSAELAGCRCPVLLVPLQRE